MKHNYLSLADALELEVLSGQLSTGMRLPSLRKLAKERNVTPAVARRALTELCRRMVAESRHGDGFYIISNGGTGPADGSLRISVVHHRAARDSGENAYCTLVLKGVQEEAQKENITLVLHYNVPVIEATGQLETLVANAHHEADAMVLLGGFDRLERNLESRVPLVGVGMENMYDGILSPVHMDPWRCAQLAREHFLQAGLHRLILYRTLGPVPSMHFEAMKALWPGKWREIVFDPHHFPEIDACPTDTGCWFEGGSEAEYVLRRHQERYGRLFDAIALDGKAMLNEHFIPVATIAPDWIQVGRMALREAVRRVREPGGGAVRLLVNVHSFPPGARL